MAPPAVVESRSYAPMPRLDGFDPSSRSISTGQINESSGNLSDINRSSSRAMSFGQSTDSIDGLTTSSSQSFPEALEVLRDNARKSNDPIVQFNFVKFLLEAAKKVAEDPALIGVTLTPDPNRSVEERKTMMRTLFETEAIKWLKRLAAQSGSIGRPPHPEAQFFLAELYGKGLLGLNVDHSKAFNLYVQASKQNHAVAAYRVAVCYELGAGTKKDNARAVQFYRKAAAFGESLAMHKLALTLLYGKLGQRKNLKEGITWLKRTANNANEAHPEGLHDLAQCYEKHGGCPVLIPDEAYAVELYSRAANYGYAPSQYRMGTFYEFGIFGCPVDAAISIKWYGRAAEQGYADAELALSGWYLSGADDVLRQSDVDAYLWARKAADRGHTKAEYAVGHYFEIGIGVPIDLDEAKKWYTKAALKNYKRAIQKLVDLKKVSKSSSNSQCRIA